MELRQYVYEKALEARQGAKNLAVLSSDQKNRSLLRMAEAFRDRQEDLFAENVKDIEYAKGKGFSKALIDRLALNEKRVGEMAQGLAEVAQLPDPVGEILKMRRRPNGMLVGRMRVPIGVIGIIYESRPNVTADASSLCMKAGNAVLLRGGSEAVNSNRIIVSIMQDVLAQEGIDRGAITLLDITDREAINEMVRLEGIVDLVIPRGGEGLIRAVTMNSRIPVLKHYKGVCHVFVDRDADLSMAEQICFNAKVQRPGTCNAMETMLVDEGVAAEFVPRILARFRDAGVEIHGCPRTVDLFGGVIAVDEEDYHREYLDLMLNVRVVRDIDEAMEHIAYYSSSHSDAIVTRSHEKAMRFLREVDSSAVFVNASTRLNDGYQFGLGAEIGISTDKIHARGPMGLEELTCTKFIVLGGGQLRA